MCRWDGRDDRIRGIGTATSDRVLSYGEGHGMNHSYQERSPHCVNVQEDSRKESPGKNDEAKDILQLWVMIEADH